MRGSRSFRWIIRRRHLHWSCYCFNAGKGCIRGCLSRRRRPRLWCRKRRDGLFELVVVGRHAAVIAAVAAVAAAASVGGRARRKVVACVR